MLTWSLYLLGAFGLAYIVGHSAISLPVRIALSGLPEQRDGNGAIVVPRRPGKFGPLGDFLGALIECPACFGFWEGVAASFIIFGHQDAGWLACAGWAVAVGCITSGFNFIAGRLTGLI
jgi:hypothetical protein